VSEQTAETRKAVLPWNGSIVADFFLSANKSWPYGIKFAQLLCHAYHAYVAGFSTASIIMAGEGLLRAVFEKIALIIEIKGQFIVKTKRKNIKLTRQYSRGGLSDNLSFDQALMGLRQEQAYLPNLIDSMYAVKSLRNDVLHGDLPILYPWDPDDPRPEDQWMEMLAQDDFVFPEGYKFKPSRGNGQWVKIDIRKYRCSSLRELSTEDRFAVIQQLLVVDIIPHILAELSDLDNRDRIRTHHNSTHTCHQPLMTPQL
jgi:hypothetical protein